MAKINKKKLKDVTDVITNLLKDEIIKQGLIVTGKMLKETRAIPKIINKSDITFEVVSTDYFKYVDGRKKIVENAFKGTKLNKVKKQLEGIYQAYIEDIIDEELPDEI